jgi:hypothetical protein
MAYQVVKRFKDVKHDGHIYEVGDTYPKKGEKAKKARLEELSTDKNKYDQVFIEEVIEDKVEEVIEDKE